MHSRGQTTLKLAITAGLMLGAIVGLVGCADVQDDGEGSHSLAITSENGLSGINGLSAMNGLSGVNGLSAMNGLSGANGLMGANGLSAMNGLSGMNGLAETSGLMTTDAGRKTVAYLVRCALPAGDSLTKHDQYGGTYTFPGSLGLCPQWKWGGVATDRSCQNMVSACMMAHINTSGVHVPLWLDSEAPQIGWGVNPNYPKQEGTFFGNIIMTGSLSALAMPGVNAPVAYYCEGAGISAGVVAGRLTAGATNVPYVNPYGTNAKCQYGQTVAGPTTYGFTAPDGYKQACANNYCFQTGEPITVWRNPSYAPVFDSVYRYSLAPMSTNGKSLDVAGGSPNNGARLQQYSTSTGDDAEKFTIVQSGPNWKIATKKNTNKCVGPIANAIANYTGLEIQDCNGGPGQAWTITADANTGAFMLKNVAAGRCLDVPGGNGADGVLLQLYDCLGSTAQKFKLASSY